MTGSTIKIDHNGDSEGNFSVLALKPYKMTRENFSCDFYMVPVAHFQQAENFPVSESSLLFCDYSLFFCCSSCVFCVRRHNFCEKYFFFFRNSYVVSSIKMFKHTRNCFELFSFPILHINLCMVWISKFGPHDSIYLANVTEKKQTLKN